MPYPSQYPAETFPLGPWAFVKQSVLDRIQADLKLLEFYSNDCGFGYVEETLLQIALANVEPPSDLAKAIFPLGYAERASEINAIVGIIKEAWEEQNQDPTKWIRYVLLCVRRFKVDERGIKDWRWIRTTVKALKASDCEIAQAASVQFKREVSADLVKKIRRELWEGNKVYNHPVERLKLKKETEEHAALCLSGKAGIPFADLPHCLQKEYWESKASGSVKKFKGKKKPKKTGKRSP
jgi:hypothetical protein